VRLVLVPVQICLHCRSSMPVPLSSPRLMS